MAKTLQKTRVVGNTGRRSGGKYKKAGSAHRSRSNPTELLGFTLGNPGRKGKGMKKHKSKAKTRHYKTKHNTGSAHHKKHSTSHRKYKRNVGVSRLGQRVVTGLFVIAGALGSKVTAQAVLGANNVGVIGYAANIAAGGILWFLAEKVMRNPAASDGIIYGTIVQVILRAIHDYTPFGSYLNQLGMGDYEMQSFVTPQVLVDPLNSAEIAIPPGFAPKIMLPAPAPAAAAAGGAAAPMAAGGAGMSGLYGGGWGGGLYG